MKLSRLVPLMLLPVLAACSGNDVTNTLGLGKEAPDEFVVVSRPPLVVPPDFDLTPPRPGQEPPHAVSTETQARKLLLGTGADEPTLGTGEVQSTLGEGSDQPTMEEFMNQSADAPKAETAVDPVISADAPTAASSSFLKNIGADSADPNIRTELFSAKPEHDPGAKSLYEKIVHDNPEEPLVDPAKESERLRSNKDEGKPVTEGNTPTQDPTKKSVLDRVF